MTDKTRCCTIGLCVSGLERMGGFEKMQGYFQQIYEDPLTDFPSFFNLVESNCKSLFGKMGNVILIDFKNFRGYNYENGRKQGDQCLVHMASVIRNILFQNQKATYFRTDGDEFTIILPETSSNEALHILNNIKSDFKKCDTGISLHDLIIPYNSNITHIEDFYIALFNTLFEDTHDDQTERKWKQTLVKNFMHRIRESLKFIEEAYELALTDDVSGLQNNRAARYHIDFLVAQEQDFSILFIDGDNLKRFNTISYEAGNKMIRVLGNIIKSCLSSKDRIFRWLSGDEFVVVVQGNKDQNHFKAERIRDAVEKQTQEWIYPVTVSIGVAKYPKDGYSLDELVRNAEKANSKAKSTGKNKVIYYGDKLSLSVK